MAVSFLLEAFFLTASREGGLDLNQQLWAPPRYWHQPAKSETGKCRDRKLGPQRIRP
jgi:hypothetical protein